MLVLRLGRKVVQNELRRSRIKNLTPAFSVLGDPTPPKAVRLLATPNPQSWSGVGIKLPVVCFSKTNMSAPFCERAGSNVAVFLRTHSVFLRTHYVFLPTHSVFMRTHSVFLRTHSVFLRTHSVHNPIAPNLWWCFTAELSCSELQSRYNPSTLFRCCVWLRGRRTHTSSRRPAARSGTRAPRKRSCAQSAASSPTCTVSGGGNFHSKWEETSRCFCWKRCHQQPWFLSWQCCNRIVATQLSVVSLHRSNAHGSRLCWRCNGFALSASSALRPVPV